MKKTVTKTNGEIVVAVQIMNQDDVITALDTLTVGEKLRIRGTIQALSKAAQDFEVKRVELVKQYSKHDDSGNTIEDDNKNAEIENETEFLEKVNELLSKNSEVEIPTSTWGLLKGTKLPFRFINAFDGIFVE